MAILLSGNERQDRSEHGRQVPANISGHSTALDKQQLRTTRGMRVTCEFGEADRNSSRWQEAAHVEVAVVVEQNSAAVVEFDFA